ncbi:MAG: AAA family ATPase [Phormidesmis sp. FL-bin-119]|nr:AAA family ATPase [Pedobacter sp.]
MKHLKKITISNARRFGKEVVINLSPGANIFIAPNGTGKTTIFEAIEFALTGSIQRLKKPPEALIRDKENGVDVRLDFDNGNFCEVNYRKGQEPKLSGNHDLLFPNHKPEDISFLLRLTHLIEQRGNNWFIQKDGAAQAGYLLDKLSIGKDLSAIAKTKTSTLGAATKTIGLKKSELDRHSEEVLSFESKMKDRDAAKLTYVLKPLNEIFDQIQSIHKQFIDSQNIVHTDQTLNAIIGYRGVVNTVIAKSNEGNQKLLQDLINLESKLPLYQKNDQDVAIKLMHVNEQTVISQKAITDLEFVRKEIVVLQDVLNKAKDLQNNLKKSKELFNKRKEEEAKLGAIENSIKTTSDSIPQQKEKLKIETDLIENLNAEKVKFNAVRQRETEVLKKQGELVSLKSVIDNWNSYLASLNELSVLISNLKLQEVALQKKIEDFQLDLSGVEKSLDESQGRLDALKTASDAILSAVGIIAANLPEDQSKCPVCNTDYEPEELKRQIAIALQQIDPVLSSEIETNKSLRQNVVQKKQQLQEEKVKLNKVYESLSENEERVKSFQALINEKCKPKFPEKKTVSEADEWLKNEKEDNHVNLVKVTADKNDFGNEPSSEELSMLKTSSEQIRDLIQSHEANIRMLQATLENSKKEIEKLDLSLAAVDTEQLEEKTSDATKAVDTATQNITNKSREQEQIEMKKKDAEDQIMDLNLAASKLNGQQNEILEQWKSCDLIDTPLLETLVNKRETLLKQADSIKQSSEELNKLAEELGRWNAAEKFETLDKEIKSICKNEEEQLYLEKIKGQSLLLELELDFITERKNALDKLFRKIGEEVDGVHEKIKAINPLWVSLLKKIVVNPRFVNTQLDSYSLRNKSQAEVKINLHDTQVSVMDVASEAQATDLQLTFMLSMASSYKWTPWKSLLLDDPTQHHDLVHASGVFDLLRDYITDQGFQILMGTHDAVQGKFFQRKLQNENIDVKLWRLIANDDGVRAEEIS